MNSPQALALSLLAFLKQKRDKETSCVLKKCVQVNEPRQEKKTNQAHFLSSKIEPAAAPVKTKALEVSQEPKKEAPKTPTTIDLYQKLVDKVKKACPELLIKQHVEVKKAQLPDCDVLFLSQKTIPDVYQSLIKAIDKQLALTESLQMEVSLIGDLVHRPFKLILAPPFLTKWPSFMSQVRQVGKKKYYLGSSVLIFVEDEKELKENIPLKQALWLKIKTALSS